MQISIAQAQNFASSQLHHAVIMWVFGAVCTLMSQHAWLPQLAHGQGGDVIPSVALMRCWSPGTIAMSFL